MAMNYDDHLENFRKKQAADQGNMDQAASDRLTALRVALEDGQGIIEKIVRPELEAMREALCENGFPAEVLVSRGKIKGIEADYVVTVSLTPNHPPILGLIFHADAERKVFTITFRTPREEVRTAHHGEITSAYVKGCCADFMTLAFPI